MHVTHSKLANLTSVEEAMDVAGLNWIAEPVELLTANGQSVKTHKAVVRSDTNDIIGIVGKDYKILQSNVALAFFNTLCQQYDAKFTDSYVLNNGATIMLKADVDGEIKIRENDVLRKRMSLINSFNGSTGLMVEFEVLRLICTNGLRAWTKDSRVYIRHTSNAESRVHTAMQVMAKSMAFYQKFEESAKILAQKMADSKMIDKFLKDLYGESESTRLTNIKDEIGKLYENGTGNGQGTMWDLYNGVTEYIDHKKGDDDHKRMISANFGSGVSIKTKAFELLTSMVN